MQMRYEAPKPDMGMNPWMVSVLIMIVILAKAIIPIIVGMLAFVALVVAWAFWRAWQDIRRERREAEEMARGR
jgi:hypothetical protein